MNAVTKQQYFNHDLLESDVIEHRDYQVNSVNACYEKNSLVVMPTALGKTIVGVILAAKHLKKYNGSKIIILAPTKPLVNQHFETYREFFVDDIEMGLLIGHTKRIKRALTFNHCDILFSTPQIIKNDVELGAYNLKDVSLIVFDEAHKARKRYAYTYIAEQYVDTAKKPFILGLTASPGKNRDVINTLIQKLKVETVCFKNEHDSDVKEYIYPIDTYIERIDLPLETIEMKALLDQAVQKIIDYFIDKDMLPVKNYYSKVDFIRLNNDIRAWDLYGNDYDDYYFTNSTQVLEDNPLMRFTFISMCVSGIYLLHMQEILTTQSPQMFAAYCKKLEDRADEGSKSAGRIINSKYYNKIIKNRIEWYETNDSPKVEKVLQIVQDQFEDKKESKIIVFTQFRDMATIITQRLHALKNNNIRAKRFVGQYSKPGDKGLSQKQQQEIIKTFKKQNISVLVATSIAEEGLDIPNVDAVIFYEPVPSEIRLIQRRGRTGRHSRGQCFIMVANDTIDSVYLEVAFSKANRMYNTLISDEELELVSEINRSKDSFVPDEKSDDDVFKFFRDIKERQKLKLEKEKELLESIQESDEVKRRKKILQQYGVNDLTQEIGKKSLKRLEQKQKMNASKKHRKYEEYRQRNRDKIRKKIEELEKKRGTYKR